MPSPVAVSVMFAASQFCGSATIHVNVAGVGSTISPRSVARTWTVCVPVVRLAKIAGLKHSIHRSGSRVSMRHSYSMNCGGVMLSVAVKLNVPVRL